MFVEMTVRMTAPQTGMNGNGYSNRCSGEAQGVCGCLEVCWGGQRGYRGPKQFLPPPKISATKTRTVTSTHTKMKIASIPDLKDFVVEIILKGLAVFYLLLLLLQLVVSLGAGAAPAPRGRLVRVVPLLFFFAVQVRRCTRR